MHPTSRYLTACAAVLVATLVASELSDNWVNEKFVEPRFDHDVIPVTSQRLDKRIINGQDAQPGSHPYIAELKVSCRMIPDNVSLCLDENQEYVPDRNVHWCGGTLIHESWVLTAAHCVDNRYFKDRNKTLRYLKIVLGEHDNSQDSCTEQVLGAKDIIVHPDFIYTAPNTNDIALIELSRPATISENVKIARVSKDDSAFVNTKCVATGWGLTSAPKGEFPTILQEVNMTVLSNDECQNKWKQAAHKDEKAVFEEFFKDYIDAFGFEKVYEDMNPLFQEAMFKCNGTFNHITEDKVCIYDRTPIPSHSSVCHGDSGGPLTCGCDHNVLVGVTSYLYFNCSASVPQVYTRVSAYIDFIEREAKINV